MSAAKPVLDIPEKPAERRAWILYRLKAGGTGFRALSRQHNCAPQSLADVARGKPMLRLEKVLAAAIGVSEKALFPEHYAKDGSRIPRVRPQTDKSGLTHTLAGHSCNVKNVEAA